VKATPQYIASPTVSRVTLFQRFRLYHGS
jgi:hypothetical protein